MISTSVSDYLQAAGQSVSLKQLAHESGQPFPLSVRTWVGALPPGRVIRKEISLDLLRSKFDTFFNDRTTPLFKFRLHGEEYGESHLTIYFDEPAVGYQEFVGPGDLGDLEIDLPGPFNPDYHFNNLESDSIEVEVVQVDPVVIEVQVDFEVQNEEVKINNFFNIDFDGFYVLLRLEFGKSDGRVDPLSWVGEIDKAMSEVQETYFPEVDQLRLSTVFRGTPIEIQDHPSRAWGLLTQMLNNIAKREFVTTNVSVDVAGMPDGVFARSVESKLNTKIFEAAKEKETHNALKEMVTTWLVGGDFHVIDVTSNGQSLFIDYVLPPRRFEPFPEAPQDPLDPGLLANIDHIVVLMMENRSFDHMLGYLSKHGDAQGVIRQDIEGLRGGENNLLHGLNHNSFPLTGTVFLHGPCHDNECVNNQMNGGKMDGFVRNYAPRAERAGINPGEVMGYHTADQLPVYDALAREFLICQRWFAAHPGPTFPNRSYTLTGRLTRDVYGAWLFDNPEDAAFVPTWEKNIFDHLSEQGVSWRYSEHEYCFLRLFARYTTDSNRVVDISDPVRGFLASAAGLPGAEPLPAVSFIDPDFINIPDGNDDQPPANIARGQHLIGEVVNHLMNGPYWGKSLLIITYDEHGGFYDHVPPPTNAPAVSTIDGYGVRVPAFVVSPWVDRGKVSNEVFDHTSILKTIIRRFLSAHPPDMGERVAKANDLSLVLRTTPRSVAPNIPVPPDPVIHVAHATVTEQATEGDRDFNALLRSVRARYPVT